MRRTGVAGDKLEQLKHKGENSLFFLPLRAVIRMACLQIFPRSLSTGSEVSLFLKQITGSGDHR